MFSFGSNFAKAALFAALCVAAVLHAQDSNARFGPERSGIDIDDYDAPRVRGALFSWPVTAQQLGDRLLTNLPPGVTVDAVQYTGHPNSAALTSAFLWSSNGVDVTLPAGIFLTTGIVPPEMNTRGNFSINSNQPGDADLDALLGLSTLDASALTITFTVDASISTVGLDLVFGSDEFAEYLLQGFNDGAGVFLDGVNIAVDGGGAPITPNSDVLTINNTTTVEPGTTQVTFPIEYDGLTPVVRVQGALSAGQHTLKIAIADALDPFIDSGVFVSNLSFAFTCPGVGVAPTLDPFASQVDVAAGTTFDLPVNATHSDPLRQIDLLTNPALLPANMSFVSTSGNPATGMLSFSPDATQVGESHEVFIIAISDEGVCDIRGITLTVTADITVSVSDADVSVSPPTPVAGQPGTISAQITNASLVPVTCDVSFYLNLPPEDGGVLLGTQAGLQIAATSSAPASVSWDTARDAGPHDIFVVVSNVDPAGDDPVDNQAMIHVTVARAADLQIVDIIAPGSATAGQTINVRWQGSNRGETTTSGSWSDRVYLSADQTLGAGDTIAATVPYNAGPLDPNAVYELNADVVLPSTSGNVWIIVRADTNNNVDEDTAEGNNLTTDDVPIVVGAAPDLVVTVDSAPATAMESDAISITWTVTNNGADIVVPWSDAVYLSNNNTIGGDTLLTTFAAPNVLAAGQSYSQTQTVTLPAGRFNNQWIVVQADTNDEVFESAGEGNNFAISATATDILPPDLAPETLTAPVIAMFGDSVSVSWSVRNTGGGHALASWSDRVYLSADSVLSGDDVILHTEPGPLPPFDPNQAYQRTAQVTLSAGASLNEGANFVLVAADALGDQTESSENNNVLASAINLTFPPQLDMAVTRVGAPDAAVGGDTIVVEYDVTNVGTASVLSGWQDAIYVSDDPALSANDALVRLDLINFAPLDPNDGYTLSRNITLPVNFQASTAYVIVKTDNADALDDADTSNNTRASAPITVAATPAPDLVAFGTSAPSSATFGDEITVTWSGRNVGTDAARNPWSDGVWLSTDNRLSADDAFVGALAANAAPLDPNDPNGYSVSLTATLPLRAQSRTGGHFLIVKADANGAVSELDESNNLDIFGPMFIDLPPLPNLSIANVASPAAVAVGETAQISWDVTNLGANIDPNAPSFLMTVYASVDGSLTGAVALANITFDQPLANGQTVAQLTDVVVPELGSPNVFFVVCADTLGDFIESDETDNCDSTETGAPYDRADLTVATLSPPSDAVAGAAALVTFTVRNDGAARAIPFWVDALFISTDDQVGEDIVLRTQAHLVELLPGGQYLEQFTVTIPDELVGDFHFILETDRDDRVIENGVAPNVLVAPFATNITQPDRPNLIVTDITAPAAGLSSQNQTVSWTVENVGAGRADRIWLDRVYISTDTEVSPDDTIVGNFVAPAMLDPNASYTAQATVEYPSAPGSYYILIQTDIENIVFEDINGGEADNTAADDVTFAVTTFDATATADLSSAPAGTPITISGDATVVGTSDPAPDVGVDVRVKVMGFERRLTVRTDAAGHYSAVFEPGPTEGGLYGVAAAPAHVDNPPQTDQFSLWSLIATPFEFEQSAVPGIPKVGTFRLRNPGDQMITGIQATVSGNPAEVNVDVALLNGPDLAGGSSTDVQYTINASAEVSLTDPIQIDFTSDQGAVRNVSMLLEVGPAEPTLEIVAEDLTNGRLFANLLRGQRSYVQFRVRNVGGGATGALNLALPTGIPWITPATPTPLPPVAPGQEAAIVLQLDPPASLPLTTINGRLEVRDQTFGQIVPVDFRFPIISDDIGSLDILVTDEFYYWDPNTPPVPGAQVSVFDFRSGALVARGISDEFGGVSFTGLPEAYYNIETVCDGHNTARATQLVQGSATTSIESFLPRQVVNYSWSVVPTDIEEEFLISITADFQANVPAPVVVLEPRSIDLLDLELPAQINFKVTNFGLITADNVRFSVGQSDLFELIPLVTDIGDMPGGCDPADPSGACTVDIPVLVLPGPATGAGGCSPVYATVCWDLVCGHNRTYCASAVLYQRNCPPPPSGSPPPPGGGGGPGGTVDPPPSQSMPVPCNKCAANCINSITCVIPDFPSCPFNIANCVLNYDGTNPKAAAKSNYACVKAGLGCVGVGIDAAVEALCPPCAVISCACKVARDCLLGPSLGDCAQTTCVACSFEDVFDQAITQAIDGTSPCAPAVTTLGLQDLEYQFFKRQYDRSLAMVAAWVYPFGDPIWLDGVAADRQVFEDWLTAYEAAIDDLSEDGELVSPAEMASLLATPFPAQLDTTIVQTFLERWNRTMNYWNQGIFATRDVPAGQSTDFIDKEIFDAIIFGTYAANDGAIADGFNDVFEALSYSAGVLIAERQDDGAGTCATVRIQLDQSVTVTRSAFRATLELDNVGSDPLEALLVDVQVTDEAGLDATDLFGLFPPEFTGAINDVSGSGSVPGGASGSVSWILLPSDDAAPTEVKPYFVSGLLSYSLGGSVVTIPLEPVRIDVFPNPNLVFNYFLETKVFSDDPFTPELEPAIPFSLGLLINNTGAGTARNVRITSSEPEIIDNERGLLIDFDIIGSQVGLGAIAPSLNVNLGDIGPGLAAVARWLMISTLQGEFVAWDATFEHINPLGDPRFSIIESVDIFGLDHVVLDDFDPNVADLLPDFLTNDFPDLEDLPDRVHLSSGAVEPVDVLRDADAVVTVDPQNLTATIDVTMPGGWTYIRIDDPFDARFPLASVTRPDGKILTLPYNAWQTDRINRTIESSPVERWLHIFDRGGSGQYTLTFDPDGSDPAAVAWHSVANYGGALGEIGLPLMTELATDPREAGISQLVVTFNEPVDPNSFGAINVFVDGFDLNDQPVTIPPADITTSLRAANSVGVIDFSPPLPTNVRYCIQLINVRDRSGNVLGTGSRLDVTSLPGDATQDRRVNNTDVGAIASLLGTNPIDRENPDHLRADLNTDGAINQADLDIALAARGASSRQIRNPCLERPEPNDPPGTLTPSKVAPPRPARKGGSKHAKPRP